MARNDRDMLLNPDLWPQMVLPIKRYPAAKRMETAIVIGLGTTTDSLVLMDGNVFDDPSTWQNEREVGVDPLLADGWMVD